MGGGKAAKGMSALYFFFFFWLDSDRLLTAIRRACICPLYPVDETRRYEDGSWHEHGKDTRCHVAVVEVLLTDNQGIPSDHILAIHDAELLKICSNGDVVRPECCVVGVVGSKSFSSAVCLALTETPQPSSHTSYSI